MSGDKILIFEENQGRRERLLHFLKPLNLEVSHADSLTEACRFLLHKNSFSLFVVNISILKARNIKTLKQLRESNPRLGIIGLSPPLESRPAIALLQQGIIDHISSPDNFAAVFSAVRNEIAKRDLLQKNEHFLRNLRKLKYEQAKNIKKALELEEIYDSTIENLMTALDMRDVETFGHSKTVAKYSQYLALALGIQDKEALNNIRKGALLHDVGKIAIPDSILKKPSPLSGDEWEKIKLHPSLGFGFIKEIKLVREAGNIILYHHERHDGRGYPGGLKKESIPLEARIFALADALDAITSHRPYRNARDFKTARDIILKNAKTQFDPRVVEAFSSYELEKWEKIRYETTIIFPPLESDTG